MLEETERVGEHLFYNVYNHIIHIIYLLNKMSRNCTFTAQRIATNPVSPIPILALFPSKSMPKSSSSRALNHTQSYAIPQTSQTQDEISELSYRGDKRHPNPTLGTRQQHPNPDPSLIQKTMPLGLDYESCSLLCCLVPATSITKHHH